MVKFSAPALLCLLCASNAATAFVVRPTTSSLSFLGKSTSVTSGFRRNGVPIAANNLNQSRNNGKGAVFPNVLQMASDSEADDEIERLRSMAAKLRAEAASLEAEKAQALAIAAERAFQSFDTNKDGEISLQELKEGLEKTLKLELSEQRVKELMIAFDASGDGVLQLDEFVGVDKFRNKLEALVRDEKELAREAAKKAVKDKEAAVLAEARLNFLNDKPPTNTDKLVSAIPYLFPLLDGLQYGRFIFENNESNPLVTVAAVLYALYRSIPFSGFAAFLALSFLSGNPSLNRLVRFNMQQAIYVDIALIIPGFITGIAGLALGDKLPGAFAEISSDAVFFALLLSLGYCTVSSLLGIAPDKLPLISKGVSDRMPTIDMFDDEGRFVPPVKEDEEKDDKDKK